MALPCLFYVAIGHAGDVVGDGAGSAFFGDAGDVVLGEGFGISGPSVEEGLDNFAGVCVF